MIYLRFAAALVVLTCVSNSIAQEWWVKNQWVDKNPNLLTPKVDLATQSAPVQTVSHGFQESVQPKSSPKQQTPQSQPDPNTEIANPSAVSHAPVKTALDNNPVPDFFLLASRAADLSNDKNTPSQPTIDFEVYRDRTAYPVDPRKPCAPCTRPSNRRFACDALPGLSGLPYIDKELGGCRCGKTKCNCRKSSSIFWPRPLSARLDERFPNRAECREAQCGRNCLDSLDRFADFRLSRYARRDNGECGNFFGFNKDPYGCLGESKQFSRVSGVQFRQPGEPVTRGQILINR